MGCSTEDLLATARFFHGSIHLGPLAFPGSLFYKGSNEMREVSSKTRFFVVLVFCVVFTSCFWSTTPSAGGRSESEMPSFVKSVGLDSIEMAASGNVQWKSREDFLAWFLENSKNLRLGRHTGMQLLFAYQSRSTQNASPAKPRVIVSVDDARFVFAMTGFEKTESDRSVEMFEANPETGETTFARLEFEEGSSGASAVLNRDTAKCSKCHGSAPRPIWDSYPFWPGFYGSVDRVISQPFEEKSWKAFVDDPEKEPLYKLLQTHLESFSLKRHRELEDTSGLVSLPGQNEDFGNAVSRLTFRRIALSSPGRKLSDWLPPIWPSRRGTEYSVTLDFWVRDLPLQSSERVAGKFGYELFTGEVTAEHTEALQRDHLQLIQTLQQDKTYRAQVSGIENPINVSGSSRDSLDVSGALFVLGFLGQKWLQGHDVSEWSNAVWYGPKTSEELKEMFERMKETEERPKVHSSVFLFEDGVNGILGLRGHSKLRPDSDEIRVQAIPFY